MLHVPVPVHVAPLHPAKTDPLAGAAVRVTLAPELKELEQVVPQLIPDGELVTDPVPAPERVTVTLYCGEAAGPKVALTAWLEFISTVQEPLPEHAPPHAVNTCPAAGVAARPTVVPELYVAEQMEPQLIPNGALEIVPVPVPD